MASKKEKPWKCTLCTQQYDRLPALGCGCTEMTSTVIRNYRYQASSYESPRSNTSSTSHEHREPAKFSWFAFFIGAVVAYGIISKNLPEYSKEVTLVVSGIVGFILGKYYRQILSLIVVLIILIAVYYFLND